MSYGFILLLFLFLVPFVGRIGGHRVGIQERVHTNFFEALMELFREHLDTLVDLLQLCKGLDKQLLVLSLIYLQTK